MSNAAIKNASNATVYLKSSGVGSDGDPHIVEHSTTLLAGSSAVGKLAANSGVDIGDVDVTSLVPGVAATSLGKAEDAAHTTGDTGVFVLTKRTDTAAASPGTDGDYASLNTDANGKVWTRSAKDGSTYTKLTAILDSADASVAADLSAAPTATQKIVIDDLVVSFGATISLSLLAETSGTVLYKLYGVNGSTVAISGDFLKKLATADKKVRVQTSGAGTVFVHLGYHSEA